MPWTWRYIPHGCPWLAPGHQHREAPIANQCGTYVTALTAPGWRAVGQGLRLMHTNSHAKLLTVLIIDPHTVPGIVLHALDVTHSPRSSPQVPQGPSYDLSWHTIEVFLKVDRGKIESFLSNGDALLLQMANNEDRTSSRHKSELICDKMKLQMLLNNTKT